MTSEELQDLHKHSLTSFENYLDAKKIEKEDHEKIEAAKNEWQVAWNKLMETLLVLERLEI